jgi:hypothetical protein
VQVEAVGRADAAWRQRGRGERVVAGSAVESGRPGEACTRTPRSNEMTPGRTTATTLLTRRILAQTTA